MVCNYSIPECPHEHFPNCIVALKMYNWSVCLSQYSVGELYEQLLQLNFLFETCLDILVPMRV